MTTPTRVRAVPLETAPSIETTPSIETALSIAQVFDAHAPYVWRVLVHLGVRELDAEDAVQEVFVVVHQRLAQWEPNAALRSWLYAIALRVAAAYRRRAHRRHETLTDALPEPAFAGRDAVGPAELVDQRRLLEALDRALATLDAPKREALVLHDLEELPLREVAALLEAPLQTVYSRLQAARRELAVALRSAGFTDGGGV